MSGAVAARRSESLAVATIARGSILSDLPCFSADHFFSSHHRQMVDRSCQGTFRPPPLGYGGYPDTIDHTQPNPIHAVATLQ
jgi:hypothetical protein